PSGGPAGFDAGIFRQHQRSVNAGEQDENGQDERSRFQVETGRVQPRRPEIGGKGDAGGQDQAAQRQPVGIGFGHHQHDKGQQSQQYGGQRHQKKGPIDAEGQ